MNDDLKNSITEEWILRQQRWRTSAENRKSLLTRVMEAQKQSWASEVEEGEASTKATGRQAEAIESAMLEEEIPREEFDLAAFEQVAAVTIGTREEPTRGRRGGGRGRGGRQRTVTRGKEREKSPVVTTEDAATTALEKELESGSLYPESFASIDDLATVRGELSDLKAEVASLTTTVEGLLAERSAIPDHIERVRQAFTADITLLLEKVEATRRTDPVGITALSPGPITQASISDSANTVAEELTAMQSLVRKAPDTSGPLATTSVTLTGKRRFKPVK